MDHWIALMGPRQIAVGYDVQIPLGREGLQGLVATAIEHAHATKAANPDSWSREAAVALTNLEQAGLWLVAAAGGDLQAWPGSLTDELVGI